jgi:hypothetical protein
MDEALRQLANMQVSARTPPTTDRSAKTDTSAKHTDALIDF